MTTAIVEHVMVVKTELFHRCGHFQGFCNQPELYLDTLLNPANTRYLPRNEMEQDPGFKQLIPYCLFQYDDPKLGLSLFQYRRGTGQGESRLHKKRSVGIGGHVSSEDASDHSPYQVGRDRELREEVCINSPYQEKLIGLINDDQNEVGKVHLGIVHLFTLDQALVTPRERDIVDAGFLPVDRLLEEIDDFETWSQICLQAIYDA